MSGVLDGDGGGFVHTLAEFASEAVQHQLGGGLASGIFNDAGNLQTDPFPFLITENILSFLLHRLASAGPPRRFLFHFQPRVDVVLEETWPVRRCSGGKCQTSRILTRVYPTPFLWL